MKIKIEYESETFLPKEIADLFIKYQKRIIENRYETDKVVCNIMSLKGHVIKWLAENSIDGSK